MTKAEQLRALIDASTHEEKACQGFLKDIALHLVPFRVAPEDIIQTGREESCRTGDSDFSVSVVVDNGALGRRYAYVWEVKAPQKYLFELDKAANRLRPSDDLYSAENQLVNYVAELSDSKNFRLKFGLEAITDEVRPGGIIIGRKDRLVRGSAEDAKKNEGLARFAFATRDAYLWSPAGIRIYTWDWVCAQLEQQGGRTSARPSAGPQGVARPPTTLNLLAYASEALSIGDEISCRTAATTAYTAVELKLMPDGWDGRKMRPIDVLSRRIGGPGQRDIVFKFRRVMEIRNRSVHVFTEPITVAEATYAYEAAREICAYLDELDAEDGSGECTVD